MKITIRKNKGKGTASVEFRAGAGPEGAVLAKALMAARCGNLDSGLPARITEELIKQGVDRADIDLKVIEPKRRAKQ